MFVICPNCSRIDQHQQASIHTVPFMFLLYVVVPPTRDIQYAFDIRFVGAQRRMQFWFNTSSINASEDIIECYFHVYKRRPLERQHVPRADRQSHSVTVSSTSIQTLSTLHSTHQHLNWQPANQIIISSCSAVQKKVQLIDCNLRAIRSEHNAQSAFRLISTCTKICDSFYL